MAKLPMANRRALGRGLSALIPNSAEAREYQIIPVQSITPRAGQPRKFVDEERLSELAESIKSVGIIQPLVVQRHKSKHVLIAGERRWRASQLAGLKEVPVIIKDVSSVDAYRLALIENIQREDLNPIEEAEAYNTLMNELGLTQDKLAKQVGKSRSAIANTLRLLKLDPSTKSELMGGRVREGHARALLALDDIPEREKLLDQTIQEKLSVRAVEKRVKDIKNPPVLDEVEDDLVQPEPNYFEEPETIDLVPDNVLESQPAPEVAEPAESIAQKDIIEAPSESEEIKPVAKKNKLKTLKKSEFVELQNALETAIGRSVSVTRKGQKIKVGLLFDSEEDFWERLGDWLKK